MLRATTNVCTLQLVRWAFILVNDVWFGKYVMDALGLCTTTTYGAFCMMGMLICLKYLHSLRSLGRVEVRTSQYVKRKVESAVKFTECFIVLN